ncbi:MAG: hypothetical protein ACRD2D_02315 [Terriglobales bacterium]
MVTHEKKIDVSDGIIRADQRDLFCFCQVAEIEEAEFSVAQQEAGGARILRGVVGPFGLFGAVGVGLGRDSGNGVDVRAIGGEDDDA